MVNISGNAVAQNDTHHLIGRSIALLGDYNPIKIIYSLSEGFPWVAIIMHRKKKFSEESWPIKVTLPIKVTPVVNSLNPTLTSWWLQQKWKKQLRFHLFLNWQWLLLEILWKITQKWVNTNLPSFQNESVNNVSLISKLAKDVDWNSQAWSMEFPNLLKTA